MRNHIEDVPWWILGYEIDSGSFIEELLIVET